MWSSRNVTQNARRYSHHRRCPGSRAGWRLRRADIPYDTLETIYSTPDTQFMTLDDGLKVHYTDTGPTDRSVLVLVHGFLILAAHMGCLEDQIWKWITG